MSTDSIKGRMVADMRAEIVDLIGSGYVDQYYENLAAPFVAIAENYAEAQAQQEAEK